MNLPLNFTHGSFICFCYLWIDWHVWIFFCWKLNLSWWWRLLNNRTIFLFWYISSFPLINNNISIPPLICCHLHQVWAKECFFTTEAFWWNFSWVKVSDVRVIEFIPFLFSNSFLNERVIMALFCCSCVNNNSSELIFIIIIRIIDIRLFIRMFFLKKTFLCIRLHVQNMWELVMIIDFESHHRIKVKLKPPQSTNQSLRQSFNTRSLDSINFLITFLTEKLVVSIQNISLDVRFQPFIDGFLVLNRQRNRNKRFNALRRMLTVFSDDFISRLPAEMIQNGFLGGRAFELALETVHEHLVEFFYVHLDCDVGWVAVPVFEGFCEGFRVCVLLFGLQQQCEQELELVQHVVGILFVRAVWVYCQDVVAEGWDHEKLLEKRDHVTNAAWIQQSNITRSCFFLILRCDCPVRFFSCPPWCFIREINQKLHNFLAAGRNISREDLNKTQSLSSCLLILAFRFRTVVGSVWSSWNFKQTFREKII